MDAYPHNYPNSLSCALLCHTGLVDERRKAMWWRVPVTHLLAEKTYESYCSMGVLLKKGTVTLFIVCHIGGRHQNWAHAVQPRARGESLYSTHREGHDQYLTHEMDLFITHIRCITCYNIEHSEHFVFCAEKLPWTLLEILKDAKDCLHNQH